MGDARKHPDGDERAAADAPPLESGEMRSGTSAIDDDVDSLGPEGELLRDLARLDDAEPPLSVGQRVGHFRVLRELGRGGMGVVYLAEDTSLRRRVALKVLAAAAASDPERRRRLLREARSAAAVTHPAIASIYEVGEHDGRVYIVMECIEGESLRQVLERGAMAPPRAIEIAVQVLRGLAAAHAGGVIHRDLKPDNIMIGPHGVVKILDFGLAKRAAQPEAAPAQGAETTTLITREGHLLGTPAYMSPEQALGDPVDARSDIFSFGVVLYEMLAGQRPFAGRTSGAILGALLTKAPPPLAGVDAQVDGPLSRVVLRCLEKEPARRYADCTTLADDLIDALRAPASRPSRDPSAASELPGAADDPSGARLPSGATPAESLASGTFRKEAEGHGRVLPSPGQRQKRRLVATSGVLVLALAGAAAWLGLRGPARETPATASSAMPVAAVAPDDARWVVACPPLRGPGGEEKSGWLGAAASAAFCERARVLLGGRPERTLLPAELLDLPAVPSADFPADPYGATGARERALSAAKQRAGAYIDGEVREVGAQLEVTLALRSADGRELGSGTGTSPALYAAVRDAMRSMQAEGPLRARPLDPEIARWAGTDDPASALAAADMHAATYNTAGTFDQECEQLQRVFKGAEQIPKLWQGACAYTRGRPSPVVAPKPSAAEPSAYAREVWFRHVNRGVEEPQAVALALQTMGRSEKSAWGRATLGSIEACVWQGIDSERARAAALRSIELAPKNDDSIFCESWATLTMASPEGRGRVDGCSAAIAWKPAMVGTAMCTLLAAQDPKVRASLAARSYLLSPENADTAAVLFEALLETGDREAARAIALRMRNRDDVPVLAMQADILLARIDAEEGRFAAALERAEKALARRHEGYARSQATILAWQGLQIAQVLGRDGALADRAARMLILAEPPVLDPLERDLSQLAAICASGSAPVAIRCLARIRALLASAYLINPSGDADAFIQAAERFVRGDARGAAAMLRPMAGQPVPPDSPLAWLMTTVFERSGEPELAARIDEAALASRGRYAGVSLAHVRAARRLAAKDPERARELARRVVTAWSVADEQPPALAEMRELASAKEEPRAPGGR